MNRLTTLRQTARLPPGRGEQHVCPLCDGREFGRHERLDVAALDMVNRDLEQKARALAGLKGYVTNLAACPDGTPVTAEFVIGACHQLFQIEKSFRMSKSDLQARPIYHRKRDSIEAHLTIVFAALAISRWIENQAGWSIRKFVRTARRYRIVQIQAGAHVVTAADPLPGDLRQVLEAITTASRPVR